MPTKKLFPGSPRPNKEWSLMIHVKDSLLLMGKVWSALDFLGILETSHGSVSVVGFAAAGWGFFGPF